MKWLARLLFDWVYKLLFGLLQGLLNLTKFIESFFDIFAGTSKIFYKGDADFLINIFFGHDAVTNAFWAMALIAIVMAFGFCIFQLARKASDVTGSVKQSVGQIFSSFIRCLLIILLLNAITVAAVNISNVLLDRINFALENAPVLDQRETEKTFSDKEYAAMAKILATVANYSANPSSDSRYNVNSCFNAIRNDLLSLHANGFFRYDYPTDKNGHYTWQGALALLASSADLTADLPLDAYYPDVVNAFQAVSQELSTYRDFAPVETARYVAPKPIETDVLIFLISSMEAAQNSMYNNGDFGDALRKGYSNGTKSYNNLKQVRKDFDIWEIDYLVGYISCFTFIIIMAICIFTFIVRLFNLLLLYLTAPLFASSMPVDEGAKWQSWTQAFAIQLFSGFGLVIAMRLYLIIIPIAVSSDLVFFSDSAFLNRMAQLLMVLGGAWAVLQSGDVITGILAGNPGMAAIQQSGRIGGMVTGWAMRAPRAALGAARDIASTPLKAAQALKGAQARHEAGQQQKVARLDRRAQQKQNKADALFAQADKRVAQGKYGARTRGLMERASSAQVSADKASFKAARTRETLGMGGYAGEAPGEREFAGIGHSAEVESGSGSPGSGAASSAIPGRAATDAPSDAAVSSGAAAAVAAATSAATGGGKVVSGPAPTGGAPAGGGHVGAGAPGPVTFQRSTRGQPQPGTGGSVQPSVGGSAQPGRSAPPPPRSVSAPPPRRESGRTPSGGSGGTPPKEPGGTPPGRSGSAPPKGPGGGTPPVPPRSR